MSDSQDAKNLRRAKEMALATAAGDNGLWSLADIKARVDAGVDVPTGAKFQYTNLRDLLDLGLAGGGSPVESQGIEEWLAANNMTPQQFQEQYGGMPFTFNPDGTASYDPAAQRQAFEYTPASYGQNLGIGLGLFGALAGAGLTGLGQGAAGAGATSGASSGIGNAITSGLMEGVGGAGLGAAGATAGELAGAAGLGTAASGINWASDIFDPNAASTFTGDASAGWNVAGSAGGTGGALNAASTGGSALSRLLGGDAGLDDYLKIGGTALSGLLGAKAAGDQTDAFTELSNKYLNLGAPARARLEQSYADPMSFLNGPDVKSITQQGSDAAARSLSATYGNPALAPNAWAEINRINTGNQWNQLSNYRNQLAAQGGLGISPASSFDASAASSDGQGYNIAGALIGDLTSPKKSMLDQMKELAGLYNQKSLFGGSVMGV